MIVGEKTSGYNSVDTKWTKQTVLNTYEKGGERPPQKKFYKTNVESQIQKEAEWFLRFSVAGLKIASI